MREDLDIPLGPGLLRKWACMLYEGLLVFGVVFVAALVFGLATQTRNALENRTGLQAFIFLVLAAYFTWFWSKGQTLAMKTWHVHLTMPNGAPVPQARALLRYFLAWVGIFPPSAVAYFTQISATSLFVGTVLWLMAWTAISQFRADRQLMHDVWAGTILTYAPPASREAKRS